MQNFADAERLYKIKLADYVRFIRPSLEMYYSDPALKRSLITFVLIDLQKIYMYPWLYGHIFGLQANVILVQDGDTKHGFLFSKKIGHDLFIAVMQDVLEDSNGQYFVDQSGYADTALHLMKCMTKHSK